jgi:hypothetical protein
MSIGIPRGKPVNYGKWIEKPLKLLGKAFPTSRMALQPSKENIWHTARTTRNLSFRNIHLPCKGLT